MKTKLAFSIILVILAALALSGCGAIPAPQTAAAQLATATAQATATALQRPTLQPTATATPIPDPAAAPEAAAQTYAAALENGDFNAAANLLSNFGLTNANLTRGEAASQLSANPNLNNFSDFSIQETQLLDETTALVNIRYTGGSKPAEIDETWVFRYENRNWLYNYANLVDTLTLDVDPQTTGGATLKPRRLIRYSDHIRLELLAQNTTNQTIVFGQPNEIMAAFHFGSETVEAEQNRIVLEPQRSYPSVAIEVQGAFDKYPESVDIRIWKNYQVDPWYSFDLTD